MTSFILIHGAGDSGWAWHLVEEELRAAGHDSVAPNLPSADESSGLADYARAVVESAGSLKEQDNVAVVGHSLGAFTAVLVADQLNAKHLIMHAGMIPNPGETPNGWWVNTGYSQAAAAQAALDGGLTGNPDELISFYNGVPESLAEEAGRRAQGQSMKPMSEPLPLESWPASTTSVTLCRDDRFFPPDFMRELAQQRLDIEAVEVPGGHCSMLGQPAEIAAAFVTATAPTR